MAIAHANIGEIENFSKTISNQQETTYIVRDNFYSTISEAQVKIQEEQNKAEYVLDRCAQSIQILDSKIAELEGKLASLQAQLAATPPTITETETDEEGNSYTVERPNPAYIALQGEIASCESELSRLKALRERFIALQMQTESQKDMLTNATNKLDMILEAVNSCIQKLGEINAIATEKLTRIVQQLYDYLGLRIAAPSLSGFGSGGTNRDSTRGFNDGKDNISHTATDMAGTEKELTIDKVEVKKSAIKEIFDNSPNWLKNVVEQYSGEVTIQDEIGRSHYTPREGKIYMNQCYDDAEYNEVFKHEFGHYIDHKLGWISAKKEFVDAFKADCDKYSLPTGECADNTSILINDLMSGSTAKYDRCISDILSATFYNDTKIRLAYDQEGLSYYSHNNGYWFEGRNRENEVFANMFAIYSNSDTNSDSVRFIETKFPNVSRAFNKIMNSFKGK